MFFGGEEGEDFFHIAKETHVEHTINLVEDEEFDSGEVNMVLFDEIEEAAGARDEDVPARAHGGNLGVLTDAAVDESLGEADVFAVG